MAEGSRRRSLAQIVVGFSAEDSLALRDDDLSFFGTVSDQSSGESDGTSSGSSSASESLEDLPSDAEENLDLAQDEPCAPLAASGPGKRARIPQEPTTREQLLQRIEANCPCQEGNCFLKVSSDTLLTIKNQIETLSSEHRQIFIAGKLDTLASRGESRGHHGTSAERAASSRSRVTYRYEVAEVKVCQTVFMYVYSASEHLLRTVRAHLNEGIVVPPPHGSEGRLPWNAVPADEVGRVRNFIQHYGAIHGLPQPAAPRGHNKPAPTYLPCVTTKKLVYSLYVKSGGSNVSYPTFVKIWNREAPSVVIMKPKEDVCSTCSDLQSIISRAKTEESRLKFCDQLKSHIGRANSARDYYKECIEKAKEAQKEIQPGESPQLWTLYFRLCATGPYTSPCSWSWSALL